MSERPRVIALCGSTRFIEPIAALAWHFEKQGVITFAPLYLPPQVAVGDHAAEAAGVKEQIDELFKRKIDLCDEVLVVDVYGYFGDSTRSEIAYAESLGKPVRYLTQDIPLALAVKLTFDLHDWTEIGGPGASRL